VQNKSTHWLIYSRKPNNRRRHQLTNSPTHQLKNSPTQKLTNSKAHQLI